VLIEPAKIPIIRGCGTEENRWCQIVSANLAEFICFSGITRLNGNTITCGGKKKTMLCPTTEAEPGPGSIFQPLKTRAEAEML
jgi:hypothetical protein